MAENRNGNLTMADGSIPSFDLRGLEPPQPAVTILRFLDRPDCGDAVIVRLERDPVFLYPELVERGWGWEPISMVSGDVRLRLVRKIPNPDGSR